MDRKLSHFSFIWTLVFITAVSSVVPAAAMEIAEIRIVGNRSLEESQILAQIRSRVTDTFETERAVKDAERIASLEEVDYCYYNTEMADGKIILTFVVVEKSLIRDIVFVGNKSYSDKTLLKKTKLIVGNYLDPAEVQSSVKELEKFYEKKGFAFVEVTVDKGKFARGIVEYTIDEGIKARIRSVKFVGNDAIKTDELKKVIKTKTRSFVFFQKHYSQSTLEKDLAKLRNIYRERGYLDANIDAETTFSEDKKSVDIVFRIDEGQIYTVSKIMISGNETFEKNRLRDMMEMERFQVYSEKIAERDIKKIRGFYKENGFIYAKVGYKAKFVSSSSVQIDITIQENDRYRIGKILITGNDETQDKVIRRILDEEEFKPGNWYNADIARGDGKGELEKDIQRSAMTERDGATITPAGEVPGQKDAYVHIIEGQTGMIMLGAGVATDSGVIGQLVFEQRNFDISDKPESFQEFISGRAFKGAGQNLRIALEPGTEISQYSVNFTEPYFQDKPVSLELAGSSWERWRETYDEGRTKAYIGFERRYKNKWRASIGFRAENVDIKDIDPCQPVEITSVKGNNMLYGVKFGIGKDTTNNRFDPSSGQVYRLFYEQVGGDHDFGILSGTHRWYHTLYEDLAERKTVLGTKIYGATVTGDAPTFEKFYAGGQGSIRGFDYRGVSTRSLGPEQTGKGTPVGSEWVFIANSEVTVPVFSDTFALLFFVDSGTIDTGSYRTSVGTGIQIMIPQWFGPVPMRFEIAAPVLKDPDDELQSFSFSIGRLF